MKIQTLFIPLAVAAVVGLGAQALATASQQPGQKPSTAPAAPQSASKPRTVQGEFVSVDLKAHTLSFKDASGKTVTAPLQARAEKEVAGLKPGDRIRLTYQDDAKGQPETIVSVQRAAAAAPAKKP